MVDGKANDNSDVKAILQEHGVTARFSALYVPDQNGPAVEGETEANVEMVRTFK